MQVEINKQDLINVGKFFSLIAPKTSSLNILKCVKMQTLKEHNKLELSLSNLEQYLVMTIDANIQKEGGACVDSKKLFEITNNVEEDIISLKLEDTHLIFKNGKSRFKILSLDKDNYPIVPEKKTDNLVEIKSTTLEEILTKTIKFVSTDQSRPMLNGICLEIDNDTIKTHSTDGRRLASCLRKIKNTAINLKQILPTNTCRIILSILKQVAVDNIYLFLEGNMICFHLGNNITIFSTFIDGRFPNVEQVIPKEIQNNFNINRLHFTSILKRVKLIDEGIYPANIEIGNNLAKITISQVNTGDFEEETEIEYINDSFNFAVNAGYLLDILSVLSSEDVILEFNSAINPFLIQEKTDKYVIMPMRG